MSNTIYETAADTAKKVRKALKEAFPDLPAKHFSVKSQSYSGGSSVYVRFTDKPSYEAVENVTRHFRSAYFDGMQDLKEYTGYMYEGQRYAGADYVHVSKDFSDELYEAAQAEWAKTHPGEHMHKQFLHDFSDKWNGPQEAASEDDLSGDALIRAVMEVINPTWYGAQMNTDGLVHEFVVRHPEVTGVKNFLDTFEERIRSYAALVGCARYAINTMGYEMVHPMSHFHIFNRIKDEGIQGLTEQINITDAVLHVLPTFAHWFKDYFEPSKLTSLEKYLMNQLLEGFQKQYPQLIDQAREKLTEETFIAKKVLTIKDYRPVFLKHFQEGVQPLISTLSKPRGEWRSISSNSLTKELFPKLAEIVESWATMQRQQNPNGVFIVHQNFIEEYVNLQVEGGEIIVHPMYVGSVSANRVLFRAEEVPPQPCVGTGTPTKQEEAAWAFLIAVIVPTLQAAYKAYRTRPSVAEMDESEMLRMQRLQKLIKTYRTHTNLYGAFTQLKGVPAFEARVGADMKVFISTRGIDVVSRQGVTSIVSRKKSDSYAEFDVSKSTALAKLIRDPLLANVLMSLTCRAFDLRKKVE